jgi:hypothetical protein
MMDCSLWIPFKEDFHGVGNTVSEINEIRRHQNDSPNVAEKNECFHCALSTLFPNVSVLC